MLATGSTSMRFFPESLCGRRLMLAGANRNRLPSVSRIGQETS
jgi:hypothetical protein